MFHRCIRLGVVVVALACGARAGYADNPRKSADPAADEELLEFLGSVDPASDASPSDDGTWIEYLSQTDIGKVAKPAAPANGDPAKPAPPAGKTSSAEQGKDHVE